MKAPFWKSPFFLGFLIGAAALTILPFMQRAFLRAPPPIGPLGTWRLVDERGHALGSDELRGKVCIAGFFFSRCPTVCPGLQQRLGGIARHVDDLGDAIHLVSFTVDPEFDTPPVLEAYARKMGADPARWSFVTGDKAQVDDLLLHRFFVDVGARKALSDRPDVFDISHAARFALVDQSGALRGLWSADDDGVSQLINAARLLARQGPDP